MSFAGLLWKDARRELRSKESLQSGVVLVGLFFILYLFSIGELSDPVLAAVALWTPMLYGTAALAGRGMATEVDRGTLALLQVLPVPAAWHGWSRTLIHFVLVALLALLSLLIASVGFGLQVPPRLWLILLLATVGLTIVGTLAGSLAAQARAREVLMPILLIPVAAPLIQSGVVATIDVLDGGTGRAGILLMLGYNIVAAGAAWLLWPFALEVD